MYKRQVVDQIHAAGFDATVVESVNVHDDIKIGLPTRDKYIENYKQCIRNLSKFGDVYKRQVPALRHQRRCG